MGDPPQRRRRRALHAGRPQPRRAARCCSSAATRPRRTGSSSALETLALACCKLIPRRTLLVAGRLVSDPRPTSIGSGSASRVTFVGRYTQREAPEIFRRAHLLLHTKVNDPCPTVVLEAMACGLPVVYPASGGTVELVGDEAGSACRTRTRFERDEPPAPEALADAVDRVLAESPALLGGGAVAGGRAVRARALARPSRGALRGARRAIAAHASAQRRSVERGSRPVAAGERSDQRRRPGGRASARRLAPGSGACAGGSRRSPRRAGRPERRPHRTSCSTTTAGSYSIRAPARTARMR